MKILILEEERMLTILNVFVRLNFSSALNSNKIKHFLQKPNSHHKEIYDKIKTILS